MTVAAACRKACQMYEKGTEAEKWCVRNCHLQRTCYRCKTPLATSSVDGVCTVCASAPSVPDRVGDVACLDG